MIVMATDGLYDNMFDDEIAAICYESIASRRRCADAAAPAAQVLCASPHLRLARRSSTPPRPVCAAGASWRRSLMLGGSGGDAPPSPEEAARAARDAESLLFTVHEAEALAQRISRTAHRYAQNPYQRTPWSVASCEQVRGRDRARSRGGGKGRLLFRVPCAGKAARGQRSAQAGGCMTGQGMTGQGRSSCPHTRHAR